MGADGSVTGEWENGFDVEVARPVVKITTPYDGQPISAAVAYDGSQVISVSGTVNDLGGRITGSAPTLKVAGHDLILSGSNGSYTFSGQVQVGRDGLIRAEASSAYGIQGADEVLVTRLGTSPLDAVAPVTPPESQTALNSDHGYVFTRVRYQVRSITAANLLLRSIDVLSDTFADATLNYVGTTSDVGRDGFTAIANKAFSSTDGLIRVEIEKLDLGSASSLGVLRIAVTSNGREIRQTVIESGIGANVYESQAVEVSVTQGAIPTPTVLDAMQVRIYKPFSPAISTTLTETGVATNVFTDGSVIISMQAGAGFWSGSPVAVVSAPSLGVVTAPVEVSASSSGDLAYSSQSLVLQSATAIAGGPPEPGSFEQHTERLPLSDLLPSPRAKRIVLKLHSQASSKTIHVTTSTGGEHDIVLTKHGDQFESDALILDQHGTGPRALSGWPTKYEVTGDPPNSDPPIKVEDQGGDAVVELQTAGDRRLVEVRRVADSVLEGDDCFVVAENKQIDGADVRLPPAQNPGGRITFANRGHNYVKVDKLTYQFLQFEVQALKESTQLVDITKLLQAVDPTADVAALKTEADKYGVTLHWRGAESPADAIAISAGFVVGVGGEVIDNVKGIKEMVCHPIEAIKNMAVMAEFVATAPLDEVDEGLKEALFGELQEAENAINEKRYFDFGRHNGHFIVSVGALPLKAGTAVKLSVKIAKMAKSRAGRFIEKMATDGKVLTRAQEIEKLKKLVRYSKYDAATQQVKGAARVKVTKESMEAARKGEIGSVAQVPFETWEPTLARSRFGPEFHRGHLIAKRFGGEGKLDNLVPMYGSEVNLSSWKRIENRVADLVEKEGKEVEFIMEAKYRKPPLTELDKVVPTDIEYFIKVDGKVLEHDLVPNVRP